MFRGMQCMMSMEKLRGRWIDRRPVSILCRVILSDWNAQSAVKFCVLKKIVLFCCVFLLSIYMSYKETATHDWQSHTFHCRRHLVSTWKSLQGWQVVFTFVKPLHLSLLSDRFPIVCTLPRRLPELLDWYRCERPSACQSRSIFRHVEHNGHCCQAFFCFWCNTSGMKIVQCQVSWIPWPSQQLVHLQ